MQLEEALAIFLVQLEADGRSKHTRDQYARHIRLLSQWSGRCEIQEIDEARLARFLISDAAKGRHGGGEKMPTSMNSLRSSLRGFFGWLKGAGHLTRDPARLIRRARCSSAPPRSLSVDEQRRLLATLQKEDGARDYAMFDLMLGSGIRVGSAVALDVSDVDLERGSLTLRTMKGGRADALPLSREVWGHLHSYVSGLDEGPLFPGRIGRRLTTRHVARRMTYWCERAGITRQLSPHTLRHSHAMNLYRTTGDIMIVRASLRHRSISSTLRYARVSEGRLREALA